MSELSPDSIAAQLEQALVRIAELEARETQWQATITRLQIAADRAHYLFENAGDTILLVDPVAQRILDANTTAARRLGYSVEELRHLTLPELEVTGEDKKKGASEWESQWSGRYVYECEYRRKDGRLMPAEVSSRFVKIGGREVLEVFVRDITRRREIEAERERLIVELDAFAHTVAHDLKNPLASLLGFVVLLTETLDSRSLNDIRDLLQRIKRAGFKMSNIVDELLVMATVQRITEVELQPLEMGRVLHEALKRLTVALEESHAEIHLTPPENCAPVMGYPAWVEEVWSNLISNAIKYGGSPPHIEIWCAPEAGGMVRYFVKDNGAGITADELPLLYREFSRLDRLGATGHGLGLSIVKRIVEQLGGTVGVESVVGEGSTFSFSLPVMPAPPPAVPLNETPASHG